MSKKIRKSRNFDAQLAGLNRSTYVELNMISRLPDSILGYILNYFTVEEWMKQLILIGKSWRHFIECDNLYLAHWCRLAYYRKIGIRAGPLCASGYHISLLYDVVDGKRKYWMLNPEYAWTIANGIIANKDKFEPLFKIYNKHITRPDVNGRFRDIQI